ncbi:RNA-binding KH domain-containing protein PEPPER [Dichanthelium oligosanthes]|uniref:RNA-binding KH domain-containing protein PEPPER n=1 Tax=Dichanthelium oligosanthes TaxID=888268 RepID=A0A1E5W6N7_9POAL|nr:RNA-binding KH domain-containing protein PEPPER [Dichanthelium oligosanthes]
MADPSAAAIAAVEVGAPDSLHPPTADETEAAAAAKRWPGWPGDSVFRLVVPVLKVGSIIGRKGELIKRLVEETKARVRILEGPVGAAERIVSTPLVSESRIDELEVLVSGKEDAGLELPPAMDALMRVFKRVIGIADGAAEGTQAAAAPGVCAARLLVPGAQAINLIGKQGATIKSIQESTGATIRVISVDERERPFYVTDDERIVEIQGETEKVLKALQAVSNHLRKFLVDHSVLPLFEKTNTTVSQDRSGDGWSDMSHPSIGSAQVHQPPLVVDEYILPVKRDPLYLEREPLVDHNIHRSGVSLYGRDPALSTLRPSGMHGAGPLLTQITQTMQIPLTYAEDIIGVKGANIAYIRANSGAVVTIQESLGSPDDITVEIKGTSSQVQAAQQLIQDSLAAHREPVRSSYVGAGLDPVYRSSYSQYGSSTYSSSSLPSYSSIDDSRYPSSGLGGYGSSYRY